MDNGAITSTSIPLLGDSARGDALDASTGGTDTTSDGYLRQTIPGFMIAGDPLCESFNDGPSKIDSGTGLVKFLGKFNGGVGFTRMDLLNTNPSTNKPLPFPTVGQTSDDIGMPTNGFWLQDTRDFYANHGKSGNILFADGSVRGLNDENGDGYFNPGFSVDSATATAESVGYLDGNCEVNPWEMYPGLFLDVDAPVKDFDSDPTGTP